MKRLFRQQKGMCFIEYAVMAALCIGVMLPAIAVIADNVLDILNDLAEDLDVIDDLVADIDLNACCMPESNEDDDANDL